GGGVGGTAGGGRAVPMGREALRGGPPWALPAPVPATAGGSSPSHDGTSPAGNGTVITIKDFGYGAPLTVAPGATVTVKQEDSVQHGAAAKAFQTRLLGPGDAGTLPAPANPGI